MIFRTNPCLVYWTFLSIALLITPIFILRGRRINLKLKFLIFFGIIIFSSRIFVEFNEIPDSNSSLFWYEKIADSFIRTVQSCSFDDDYSYFLLQGRKLFESWGYPVLGVAYSVINSIANIVAPIAAGAYLVDLLTNLFPYLRILISPFRKKFIFSNLNTPSLLLFEDIVRKHKQDQDDASFFEKTRYLIQNRNSLFIFCNVNSSSTEEEQLIAKAKQQGAICIKRDFFSLDLHHSSEIDFFLMNSNPSKNLIDLSRLLSSKNSNKYPVSKFEVENNNPKGRPSDSSQLSPRFHPTQIYVFIDDQNQADMIDLICQQCEDEWKRVLVLPIAENRMTAINLIKDIPLFLPLLPYAGEEKASSENKKKSLDIVIFGGNRCIELFKAIFWVGQIPNYSLSIQIITPNPDEIHNQIQIECPELFESCQTNSQILKVYRNPEDRTFADPYADIKFYGMDDLTYSADLFKTEDELKLKSRNCTNEKATIFQQSDVFIVANDEDLLNIRLSAWLSRLSALNHITSPEKKTIILPLIRSKALADGIRNTDSNTDNCLPIIYPFGMYEKCYSCVTILNDDFAKDIKKNANEYIKKEELKPVSCGAYEYWSDLARSIHAKYKLFGMGWIESFSFDENHSIQFKYPKSLIFNDEDNLKLSYSEHRRWNAYLRTNGYRSPDLMEFSSYSMKNFKTRNIKSGRNEILKLHPCLVEKDCKESVWNFPSLSSEDIFKNSEWIAKYNIDYLDFISLLCYQFDCEINNEIPTFQKLKDREYKKYDFFIGYDSALQSELSKIQVIDQTKDHCYERPKNENN